MKINKSTNAFRSAFFGLLLLLTFSTLALAAAVNVKAQTTNGPLTIPADPEQSTTLEQRVAARGAASKAKFNSPSLQSIAAKCTLAQTALGVTKTKDASARQIRSQAYINIATRLNNIVENLSNQRFDVSDLGSSQTKLNLAMNKYLDDVMNYKTTMDDLVDIDCNKNPAGFEYTLLEARSLRATLASDISNIKTNFSIVSKSLDTMKQTVKKASH
jgi:hypothetical protein